MRKKRVEKLGMDEIIKNVQQLALRNAYIPPGLRDKIEIRKIKGVYRIVEKKKKRSKKLACSECGEVYEKERVAMEIKYGKHAYENGGD